VVSRNQGLQDISHPALAWFVEGTTLTDASIVVLPADENWQAEKLSLNGRADFQDFSGFFSTCGVAHRHDFIGGRDAGQQI
jgi:hypothetical protein